MLEIGVHTGVVALGLLRRGRKVIGLDLSAPMLAKARARLGPVVIRSDALDMALATASVDRAVSVWVVHSVADPIRLFVEAARVIRPGGRDVVCSNQNPAPDDPIGQIISDMSRRIDIRRVGPRAVTAQEILVWAGEAGFTGAIHEFDRHWESTPAEVLEAIRHRTWPAMPELDEASIEATMPAIEALS